jgi:hypothetical protein
MDLVVACARVEICEEQAQQIRDLLKQPIDWSYVFESANRHFVAPLLCFHLVHHFRHDVPDSILNNARQAFEAHVRRNLFLTQELIKVVKLLDTNGIPVLPFKGPVLAVLAYRNLALRQFADLDILIPHERAARAMELLVKEGYGVVAEPLNALQRHPSPLARNKDVILFKAGVRIELHWRLTGKHFDFPLEAEWLWNAPERVSVAGFDIRSLPASELLLFLCMHGSRHGWERLQWICDIAEFLRTHTTMDWRKVWDTARLLRNERNLALGLRLAHDVLGLSLPDAVHQRVAIDPAVSDLSEGVYELLLARHRVPLDISYWRQYHLQVKERLRDRIRLRLHYSARYLRLATSPTMRDRSLVMLPAYLSFLYYVLRPIRLLKGRLTARISRFALKRKLERPSEE